MGPLLVLSRSVNGEYSSQSRCRYANARNCHHKDDYVHDIPLLPVSPFACKSILMWQSFPSVFFRVGGYSYRREHQRKPGEYEGLHQPHQQLKSVDSNGSYEWDEEG